MTRKLNHGMRRPLLAVAGGTGRVGGALIANLHNDPVDIVALTRGLGARNLPSGVTHKVVNFDEPGSLANALHAVDRLFLAHGTSPQQVRNEIALIDAAVAAGVDHIVKLSVMGPASKLHPFDWHMEIERHLACQDLGYTILRPSSFVDILARAGGPVANGSWGGAAGHGRVNLVDTRDVADAARIALLDDMQVHTQRAYHLTGPGTISMPEVAEELSVNLGKTISYDQRTPDEQRTILIASGVGELVADVLLGIDHLFRGSVLAETTSTFASLTGRPPRSVQAWLRENIALFQQP